MGVLHAALAYTPEAIHGFWGEDGNHEFVDMYLGYYGSMTPFAGVLEIDGASSEEHYDIRISCSAVF